MALFASAARIAGRTADAAHAVREIRGASVWAPQLVALSRGMQVAREFVQTALVDGSVGVIVAPGGKLSRILSFTFTDDRIARLEVIGDPARLRELDIATL